MAEIREATDRDVEKVRDLFVTAYGEDYPFPGFYDTHWLKKSVYDDNTLFLVAETGGEIVATGSMMLTAGDYDDMLGELGRLVAEPSKRARGAAGELIVQLIERTIDRVHFAMAEVRTAHGGSQRLADGFGWAAMGFEPLKYRFHRRESVVLYGKVQGLGIELRRNNPRLIPEAAPLAQTALRSAGLPVDVVVEDEVEGYPTHGGLTLERLKQDGISPLLRIERGRVRGREVFGNLALAHGFFRMADTNSHYLVARDGDAVLGAIGFTHDPIDRKVRVFELIEFDDAVKGYLLASVDALARQEFAAEYQEIDISAYSPRMQRTLERLGFVPVAYCPSMVFSSVERLDVLRMAKVCCPYELGPMKLRKAGKNLQRIVEQGLEDRMLGMEVSASARKTELFRDLPDGDLYRLARLGRVHAYDAETVLVREGDTADRVYLLLSGTAQVRSNRAVIGSLEAGTIFGEMALLEGGTRTADVVLTEEARVAEVPLSALERLMEANPRLGYRLMRNLAGSLSHKLLQR